MTASDTLKPLSQPRTIGRFLMPTLRAGRRSPFRRQHPQQGTLPLALVFQHSPERVPALIQNRLVETRLHLNQCAGMLHRPGGRCAHLLNFQILDHEHCVAFAKPCRSLMQKVLSNRCNLAMDALYLDPCPVPVLAESDLARQGPLRPRQTIFPMPISIPGFHEIAIGQGCEFTHPQVDTDRIPLGCRGMNLALNLEETYQRPAMRRTVALRISPPTGQDLRNFTQPIFGRKMRGRIRRPSGSAVCKSSLICSGAG